jgi:hypothetical protein
VAWEIFTDVIEELHVQGRGEGLNVKRIIWVRGCIKEEL